MSDPDRLPAIKARWFTDDPHRAEYWADLASRDVPTLIDLAARLHDLLARLEWAVVDPLHGRCCPACDGVQPDHDPGCELAAVLHPDPEQAP